MTSLSSALAIDVRPSVPSPVRPFPRVLLRTLCWLALAPFAGSVVNAQGVAPDPMPPFRVGTAAGLPPWLRVRGSTRVRYEGIEGQYRANPRFATSDHLVVVRTLLGAEVDVDDVTFGVEVIDARQLFGGTRSVVDGGTVSTLDLLQAYGELRLGDEGRHRVRVGRQALSYGSGRVVFRHLYRNTVNTFTGVEYRYEDPEGAAVDVFWSLPAERRPAGLTDLLDGDVEFDQEDIDRQFFGAFGSFELDERSVVETYAFGLVENAGGSRRRKLVTPGVRLLRVPEPGRFDGELEVIGQFGESRATPTGPDLDHVAWLVHASVGRTFDVPWQPRLRLALDVASGDRRAGDGSTERFDTLFGAQRFDFGPAGIYLPTVRRNLISPELRLEVRPAPGVFAFVAERSLWLQSEVDATPNGGVVDASGASGNYLGQQVEAIVRYELVPQNVQVEIGGAYLFADGVLNDAPNARGEDVAYMYVQTLVSF